MTVSNDDEWTAQCSPKYKPYTLVNFREIEQISNLSEQMQFEIEVAANVFPFKTNNYVIDNLIDWKNPLKDPMFVLTFPQKEMLLPHHYDEISTLLQNGADKKTISDAANKIRLQLNPHPAGQMEMNVPSLKDGTKLFGIQHKYPETCLFFASQGQTCHAYCTFCFRWPQFVGMSELRFATHEVSLLIQYLKENPQITDILFTGGDPMIMKARVFGTYVNAILDANLPNLSTIRIGTRSLTYWPYKFLTDDDSDDMLEIFNRVNKNGLHLSIMAHFNHHVELKTSALCKSVKKIRDTGAQIRTQSPLLRYINDDYKIWSAMWQKQVSLGMIPYYMFIVRDTGAQHFFGVPLTKAHDIFKSAYQTVSGLGRTVRGPSMSTTPGKVQVLGVSEINGQKVIILQFLQGRNPDWVGKPFFAKFDENAIWLDDLKPAFSDTFFYQEEFYEMKEKMMPKSV